MGLLSWYTLSAATTSDTVDWLLWGWMNAHAEAKAEAHCLKFHGCIDADMTQ